MGEMADYYADLAMQMEDNFEMFNEEHHEDILKKYLKCKLFWTMKDGREILVQKMEGLHLNRTLAWLKSIKGDNLAVDEWIDVFELEHKERAKNAFPI